MDGDSEDVLALAAVPSHSNLDKEPQQHLRRDGKEHSKKRRREEHHDGKKRDKSRDRRDDKKPKRREFEEDPQFGKAPPLPLEKYKRGDGGKIGDVRDKKLQNALKRQQEAAKEAAAAAARQEMLLTEDAGLVASPAHKFADSVEIGIASDIDTF